MGEFLEKNWEFPAVPKMSGENWGSLAHLLGEFGKNYLATLHELNLLHNINI
jgi:hypothetical protein